MAKALKSREGGKNVFSYKIFDEKYEKYDEWYKRHPEATNAEIKCIRLLASEKQGSLKSSFPGKEPSKISLEIGVGTGVFAKALSITVGVDPASNPLQVACKRGVEYTVRGVGESLPFRDKVFHTILIVVTLCFAADPEKLMREAYRVLRDNGIVIVCIVPRNSFHGVFYIRKSSEKTSFYRNARFFSVKELLDLMLRSNLTPLRACTTLEWGRTPGLYYGETQYIEYPHYTDTLTKNGFYCVLSKKVK